MYGNNFKLTCKSNSISAGYRRAKLIYMFDVSKLRTTHISGSVLPIQVTQQHSTQQALESTRGPDACVKPSRIQCFLTDWGHHCKDRWIDIRVRKTNLLIIRFMFFLVSTGRTQHRTCN